MPEVTGGFVLEVIVEGFCLGQDTINRYFYHSPTSTETLEAFISEFNDLVLLPCANQMVDGSGFVRTTAQYVRGGSAFKILGTPHDGGLLSDALPPFVSYDFTYLRGGVGERNGYKRIAGVAESQQVGGIAVPAAVTALNGIALAMFSDVSIGSDDWTPVIQRKVIDKVIQIPPKYYSVSDVVYAKIGSQNSRKYGHGS